MVGLTAVRVSKLEPLGLYFLYVSIYNSHSGDVNDVAYRTLEIGEVYRLVQTHLNGADNLGIWVKGLQQFVATIGTAHVGEYQCVDILAL